MYIEGEEESQQEQEAVEVSPDEVKKGLVEKFDGVMGNPIMKKIFDIIFDFRVNKRTS